MKLVPFSLLAGLVVTLMAAFRAQGAESPELKPIFNGKDLTGWQAPETYSCWLNGKKVMTYESESEPLHPRANRDWGAVRSQSKFLSASRTPSIPGPTMTGGR